MLKYYFSHTYIPTAEDSSFRETRERMGGQVIPGI
jgi:hypothetical protein